jgi:hypothetical protein
MNPYKKQTTRRVISEKEFIEAEQREILLEKFDESEEESNLTSHYGKIIKIR